jgi:hypothetical protein
VTARGRLTGSLLVCCLVALAFPGASLPAEKPSPQDLWELYPLDPSGRGPSERPPTPSPPADQPSRAGGVAGTSTTKRDGTRPAGSTVAAESSDDDGTPLSLGILIGGVVAAILMLGLAILPEPATGKLGRFLADRRVEMAVAGMLTLLIVTVVYLFSSA